MAKITSFTCNPYRQQSYLVTDENGTAVLIDSGFSHTEELDALDEALKSDGSVLVAVLLTHAHFDHIYGVKTCIAKYGAKVYLHPAEAPVLEGMEDFATRCGMRVPDFSWESVAIGAGEVLSFGGLDFEVLETPGHSPGSVSYLMRKEKVLFSGDTLFRGTIGNTQLPWADYDKEIVSVMEVLMALDSETVVFPGHGEPTTISGEKTGNPFLQPFNFKDSETGYIDGIEQI